MSANTDISPGQALVYSVTKDDQVEYRFRLYNGEEGEASLPVIQSLDLDILALPVVVDVNKLAMALFNSSVTLSEFALQMMQKADTNFVKSAVQTRVSINTFRDFIAKVAMSDTVNLELLKKADLEYVNSALHGKVDRGQVYTINELHRVLMQFLGARGVYNIAERDALEYGMYPFVWVLDASDDDAPNVESPALYKWNVNHWIYLGTVGNFGFGSGDFSNYYTKQEVDRLLAALLPSITSADDIGKVICVAREIVSGNVIYKYVLAPIDFSRIEQRLDHHDALHDNHNARLSNHEGRITALENTQGGGSSVDLSPILTRLSSAENRLDTDEGKIADVEDRLTADEASISAAEGRITTNETKIGNAEDAIVNHESRITDNESEISNAKGTITNHESRIDALENRPGQQVDLEPILTRLSTVEGKVATLEEIVGYVNTEVTNVLTNEFNQEV